MPCESCHAQFGLITRKKSCYECRRLFCRNCLEKRQERILCHNCLIFTKRPLSNVDLGQLKVKDLIFFLQSKHISTSGCVEKDDLINLVIAHVNSGASSPRSPVGSAGSGNGRTFNVSSASSTGGSSGGGVGGRSSQSGGSSRYGNFYAASVENCTNTYDQIRNTCQNLFTSITDKLGTEENLRQRGQAGENVSQQPRFGSNDVYRVNSRQSNNDSSQASVPEATGSDAGRTTIVPNEGNFSSTNGNTSGGSGITSGADSSSNTSSVSSPAGRQGSTAARLENVNLSLSARIDNMLASDANQNGCECSDDEGEFDEKEAPHRKDSAKSEDNLITAGPSQSTIGHMTVPESKTDTSSSSFDELNQECINSLPGPLVDDTADADRWQIVNSVLSGTVTMTETTDVQKSTEKLVEIHSRVVPCSSQIHRRRSDSCLILEMKQIGPTPTNPVHEPVSAAHSSQSQATVYTTNKCFRCGKRRSSIRKQLKKFRKQLETARGASEMAKRQQLEAFLSYLERRSKGSFELTDSESITEEPSSSLAEIEPNGSISASISVVSQLRAENMPSDESRLHFSYPQADGDEAESINIYSAGNQELASKSHIKLSDIKESADLDILSVKQLKEILMLNRVDFKGCCEKPELRERVLRLWRDYKSIPSIEKLPSDDLCKICMDAPIECVILECGHMTTCTACGKVLSECPICRQYIVRVVRFFRA
ncbi:RING finger protein B [Topomyia yanbarensis]|uniref:RING finger protein B n=1 Tax=Topomyia yanbarensis TaxID=2498891 RepID=UPI00273BE210|nr:RING finger protein B [Topomyia yanbarensis]